jgi:chromosome segregation ATPase
MIKNMLVKFKKQPEEELVVVDDREVMVSVPEIKEYLVKEYERSNNLQLRNEMLEQRIEKAEETRLKYEATLVTLDEYSKRLESADKQIASLRQQNAEAKQETASVRSELNAYKIKFNEAAITRQEVKDEVIRQTKQAIIDEIRSIKGNLSKQVVCDFISQIIVNIEE